MSFRDFTMRQLFALQVGDLSFFMRAYNAAVTEPELAHGSIVSVDDSSLVALWRIENFKLYETEYLGEHLRLHLRNETLYLSWTRPESCGHTAFGR